MFIVYCFVAVIVLIWGLLMMSGWCSLRWTRTNPDGRRGFRFLFALVPVFIGLLLLSFHLRWTMNSFSLNLSWPFVFPVGLGAAALVFWVRARGRPY